MSVVLTDIQKKNLIELLKDAKRIHKNRSFMQFSHWKLDLFASDFPEEIKIKLEEIKNNLEMII